MPEDTKAVAASRRGILAGIGGALLGGAAVQASQSSTSGPDAELIGLCAKFDALQRRILDSYSRGANYIEDDEERREFIEPLGEIQEELLDEIVELRAVTAEGFVARAKMLRLYDQDMFNPLNCSGWDDMMMLALIRDMVGEDGP